jgi:hypothetical protein
MEMTTPRLQKPGSWNLDNRGKDMRRRPKRRLTRIERIDSSIVAAQAEITVQRRRLLEAQARIAEAKTRLRRLEGLRARLAG